MRQWLVCHADSPLSELVEVMFTRFSVVDHVTRGARGHRVWAPRCDGALFTCAGIGVGTSVWCTTFLKRRVARNSGKFRSRFLL